MDYCRSMLCYYPLYSLLLQHIVFALKFLIAYLIPDVPRDVQLSIRRVSKNQSTFSHHSKYKNQGYQKKLLIKQFENNLDPT